MDASAFCSKRLSAVYRRPLIDDLLGLSSGGRFPSVPVAINSIGFTDLYKSFLFFN